MFIVHQTVALGLRVLAAAVVPDQAPLLLAHLVVQLALQPVLEIEEEKEVVAKALMPRGDMTIKRRREIRKGKGKEIGTRTEIVIKKERKGTMLFRIRLNKNDPGIVFIKSTLIF